MHEILGSTKKSAFAIAAATHQRRVRPLRSCEYEGDNSGMRPLSSLRMMNG
jgi:hypothetical protein